METSHSTQTWTMDDAAYDSLPDRVSLTGMPLLNQPYRDSTDPERIFRFYVNKGTAGPASQWQSYVRIKPAP